MGVLKKDLSYYLSLRYHIVIKKDFDYDGKGYYIAEIPDLPGCGAEGKTVDEALEKIWEAKRAWIEVRLERGLNIPEPKDNVNVVTIYDIDATNMTVSIEIGNNSDEEFDFESEDYIEINLGGRKNNECKSS